MIRIVNALLVALVGGAAVAAAQEAPAYGIESATTYVVTAWDFMPSDATVSWDGAALENGHRYATSSGSFLAGARLPQGSQILSIEFEACDTSASGQAGAILFRTPLADPSVILATAATGVAETPGCGFSEVDLAVPETVENNRTKYYVVVTNTSFDGSTSFGAVRIRYQLQVSPAPLVPTFNDVPTSDPAFQFVEALAASGITAGCGGGNYCPDASLTRRQMAVFLSKALGLHWPDGSAP
jgi:hypothetical protein